MSLLEVNQLKFSWIIYRNFLHAEIRIELIQHSLISHHYGKLVFIDLCMYSTNQNFIASLHMVFYKKLSQRRYVVHCVRKELCEIEKHQLIAESWIQYSVHIKISRVNFVYLEVV